MHTQKYHQKNPFRKDTLYHEKNGSFAVWYLRQKSSFWIASFSLLTFIAGNMIGQHGWYTFWNAVWGKQYEDHLIVYTGTVSPVTLIPDYKNWKEALSQSYTDVPENLLMPLPWYDSFDQKQGYHDAAFQHDVYSIGHMGSYLTGGEGDGSHPGVDIRVPIGTPIVSIANGIVTDVQEDRSGFGKYVVIRHPHAPDPDDPSQLTVLYSVYAHLSEQLVQEGDTVIKGQKIALSGMTGFATGPHLHFQIDRDSAPWHPYWPFTTDEAVGLNLTFSQAINSGFHQERGQKHTVHSMLYVQADYPAISTPLLVQAKEESKKEYVSPIEQILARREERRQQRLSRRTFVELKLMAQAGITDTIVEGLQEPEKQEVAGVEISHDGRFIAGQKETIVLTLVDDDGKVILQPQSDIEYLLRPGYGDIHIEPTTLSANDFHSGMAKIQVLSLDNKTMVLHVLPMNVLSEPLLRE